LELPEVLLFQICSFVAGPTQRATVICQLASLCQGSRTILLHEDYSIWGVVLQQDYGVTGTFDKRRSSKRLKKSYLQQVRRAHQLALDNTEIAYYYLTELCTSKKNRLSRNNLCSLLHEYGPHLRMNHLTNTGGTFLVECCRARYVRECTILKCVEELVGNWGACVALATNESRRCQLTALSVASARGMPAVVRYLLKEDANREARSTGRFRLHSNARKTISCQHATPLEFATKMRDAELEEGVAREAVKDLDLVIEILENVSR